MMDWSGHMSTAGWIFSVLWTVIIIALVVVAVVWLVSALSERRDRGTTSRASAREILDQRLASGELTIEQYEQLRDTLGDGRADAGSRQVPPRPASAHG